MQERVQGGDKTFKVHIDGYNLLPYLTGKEKKSPRPGFIYFDDDGNLVALRYDNWKCVFMEQRCEGTLRVWAEPFTATPLAQALQSTDRSIRARRYHFQHILRLVSAPRLHHFCGAGHRG